MHHRIEDTRGGEGMGSWITPRCSCGWTGSRHYSSASRQHLAAREQFEHHKRDEEALDAEA